MQPKNNILRRTKDTSINKKRDLLDCVTSVDYLGLAEACNFLYLNAR